MKVQRNGGFTLVELLVVMAIIVILTSLLLPALARAKEESRRAFCDNNLRQWGTAFTMYADDSSQFFPAAKITNGTPGDAGFNEDAVQWSDLLAFAQAGQGYNVWYNVLPPYIGKQPLYQYAADPTNFVNSKTIFTCPTSDAIPPDFNLTQRVIFNYGMNYKGNTGLDPTVQMRTTLIWHPSAFVFLSESRTHASETPFYGTSPSSELGTSHCCYAMESSRHNSGAVLNFADGHAAYYKYQAICLRGYTRPQDPGNPNINWTFNGVPVPNTGTPAN